MIVLGARDTIIFSLSSLWNRLRNQSSVLWVVEFWKERITETPHTSMRMLGTQNSCFAQFTQHISSVSTEQFQAGVKSSLNGLRIKKSRLWRSSRQRKRAAAEKCEATRSDFFGAISKEPQSGIWKQIVGMSSEVWNTGERFPIFESLWRCNVCEKSVYWDKLQNCSWRKMIVLETEPQPADNTHFLAKIKIQESM